MSNDLAATQQQNSTARFLEEAQEFQQQAQNSQAIAKYLEALAVDPNLVSALEQLAKLYETEERFDQAVNYYQRVVKLQPNESLPHVRLAKAMMGQNDLKGAIAAYQRGVALNPDSRAWVYHNLGDALIKNGQSQMAISAYRQALKQQPANPVAIERKLDKVLDCALKNPLIASR